MSDKAKKNGSSKQSVSTTLPATPQIDELPATDLDYVSGGCSGDLGGNCGITRGCGLTCGPTKPLTQ